AAAGRGAGRQHRDRRADVRGRAPGPLLQHRGGDRRRRQLPGQVPQDAHPPGQGVLGEVLLPAGQHGLPGARIVFTPSATSRGLSQYLWRLEQPAAAVANEYFIGAINRVGIEPLGDNEFYGQTYFADPRGQLVGEAASDTDDEVVVRDLDMDQLAEVRDLWQFYRDRRPDQYGPLVTP